MRDRRPAAPPVVSAPRASRLLLLFLVGCASGTHAPRTRTAPPPPRSAPAAAPVAPPPLSMTAMIPEVGIATHYADRFAGRKTASGELYRPAELTAAHRTLPFGTVVRVTRIDRTGSAVAGPVLVRVNDRGPYGAGRVIDLSAAAARSLRMLGGLSRVRVEVVQLPPARRSRR